MFAYKKFDYNLYFDEVRSLYQSVGWIAYINDEVKLKRTFNNSLYILGAFDKEKLVGLVRCVGDGEHILLVQDLLVLPQYQKKGIGTKLFQKVWDKYSKVRMFQVFTDLYDEVDNHFYQSFGMKKLEEGQMVSYFR